MDYKNAWEQLRLQLLTRGEYFFFAKGDDEDSVYTLGEISIETTLKHMDELENQIKQTPDIHNLPSIKK